MIIMLGIILSGAKDKLFKADLIVVLGNKVYPDGHPSVGLRDRLDRAIEIYQAGYAPLILVSGGVGKEGVDESVAMETYLIQHHVPMAHIVRDGGGNNTRATAQNTFNYLQQKQLHSVIVVSQYYHIARSKLAFQQAGIEKIGQAPSTYFDFDNIYSIFREMIGYPFYYFKMK